MRRLFTIAVLTSALAMGTAAGLHAQTVSAATANTFRLVANHPHMSVVLQNEIDRNINRVLRNFVQHYPERSDLVDALEERLSVDIRKLDAKAWQARLPRSAFPMREERLTAMFALCPDSGTATLPVHIMACSMSVPVVISGAVWQRWQGAKQWMLNNGIEFQTELSFGAFWSTSDVGVWPKPILPVTADRTALAGRILSQKDLEEIHLAMWQEIVRRYRAELDATNKGREFEVAAFTTWVEAEGLKIIHRPEVLAGILAKQHPLSELEAVLIFAADKNENETFSPLFVRRALVSSVLMSMHGEFPEDIYARLTQHNLQPAGEFRYFDWQPAKQPTDNRG